MTFETWGKLVTAHSSEGFNVLPTLYQLLSLFPYCEQETGFTRVWVSQAQGMACDDILVAMLCNLARHWALSLCLPGPFTYGQILGESVGCKAALTPTSLPCGSGFGPQGHLAALPHHLLAVKEHNTP